MKCYYYDGCTDQSLTINNVETIDMPTEEFRECLKKMLDKVDDTADLQRFFMDIMELYGECKDLGQCSQCGDWNYEYTLEI